MYVSRADDLSVPSLSPANLNKTAERDHHRNETLGAIMFSTRLLHGCGYLFLIDASHSSHPVSCVAAV